MESVKTTRGGQRLLYEGYAYIMDRKRNSLTYWRCEKKKECTGRLTTENNNLKNPPSVHSHPPDPARIAVSKTVCSYLLESPSAHRRKDIKPST